MKQTNRKWWLVVSGCKQFDSLVAVAPVWLLIYHACIPSIDFADRLPGRRGDRQYIFRIISPACPPTEIAASSEDEMQHWIASIRDCSNNAEKVVRRCFLVSAFSDCNRQHLELCFFRCCDVLLCVFNFVFCVLGHSNEPQINVVLRRCSDVNFKVAATICEFWLNKKT